MKNDLLLRFVVTFASGNQVLHPVTIVAASENLYPIVHDLDTRAIGLSNHRASVVHLWNTISVATSHDHFNARLVRPDNRNHGLELVWVLSFKNILNG